MKPHIFLFYVYVIIISKISQSSKISPNAIYEIIAKTDSKRCYTCEGICDVQELQSCEGANKCFAKVTTTGITKGCVEAASAGAICNSNTAEEVSSCYTCDGDFCNSSTNNDEIEDWGVTECYVCIDECADPPETHLCEEVLTEMEGKKVKAACLSYKIEQEESVTISKGCVPDRDEIRGACNLANVIYEEITCSICETDLCNYVEEVEENVEECYYCEDVCEKPLGIHNCREVLGDNATSRCLAVDTSFMGQYILYRGCVDYTQTVQTYCNMAGLLGGSCSICDTNLCNGFEDDEEPKVEECYYCEDVCEKPLATHNCTEVLGENATSRCLAVNVNFMGQDIVYRGCVDYTETVEGYCSMAGLLGGTCSICDTDLCNDLDDNEENYVNQCYFCEGICQNPLEIHHCENDRSKCYAIETVLEGVTVTSRGCTDLNEEFQKSCDDINTSGGNCTICDTDLCNGNDEEIDGDNVDECYYCENVCTKPLSTHNCTEVLGEGATSRCISVNVTYMGQDVLYRGCVDYSATVHNYCNMAGLLGGSCSICDTNLCNDIEEEDEDDENYTNECYYCRYFCENPLQTRQCKGKSKCYAIELEIGGDKVGSRDCVEADDDLFHGTCDDVNRIGGNCTICDTNLCNTVEEKEEDGSNSERITSLLYILLFCVMLAKLV